VKKILGFKDEHSYMSNMFKCNIIFHDKFTQENRVYNSSEQCYQAFKAWEKDDFLKIATENNPYKCKKLGRQVLLDEGFDEQKISLMKKIVYAKFRQNEEIQKLLVDTFKDEPCYIEETNNWKDTFWGVCDGVGENHMGKILMEVRLLLSTNTNFT